MVTNTILTFWNRKYKYYCLYFSFITLYPSFITLLWQAFAIGDHFNCNILLFRKWIKKVVFYVGISSVCIKQTEHNMAAWGYEFYLLVLKVSLTRSLRFTRERYFQHSKIKFVSLRGHVISSMFTICSTNSGFVPSVRFHIIALVACGFAEVRLWFFHMVLKDKILPSCYSYGTRQSIYQSINHFY